MEVVMQSMRRLLTLFLCCALVANAQGNSFKRVRYNGGSVASKVDPKEWKNTLTVTSEMITLRLKDGQGVDIPAKQVTSLSYGQEAHRRVGTMVALAILIAPVALFGLLHKTRLHFIGIQYATPDGKSAGILLQGDKDNYRGMLVALQGVTGVPVSVAEKEREFIPVGVRTDVAKDSKDASPTTTKSDAPPLQDQATGTVVITSVPDSADVLVDGTFVGNCPATLKLQTGKHKVVVKMAGYNEWSKEISVQGGSDVHLNAVLEKNDGSIRMK
jgi:hypothetical protein